MTPEQQRIAIAEACGWVRGSDVTPTPNGKPVFREWWDHPEYFRAVNSSSLPDYYYDLNAMHEAEKILDPLGKSGAYEYWLRTLCKIPEREPNKGRFFYRATTTQRAEAFLRTIGKWENGSHIEKQETTQ